MRKIVLTVFILAALVWGIDSALRWFDPLSNVKGGILQAAIPLSREEAQPNCPITLPEGATNIQYAVWSQWQAAQTYVRFEAPVSVCLEHAKAVMQTYAVNSGKEVTQSRVVGPLTMPLVISPTELKIPWFDLPRFSAGVAFKVNAHPSPTVWVDTNRGCFYLELND
jgi:hypothetical protein